MQTEHRVLNPVPASLDHTSDPATLVWVDSTEAFIVHWNGRATIDHVSSDVPPRHRRTGHVRRNPAVGHGCSGPAGGYPDRDRSEHLRTFLGEVARLVPETGEVRVVGPGVVRELLTRLIVETDRHHGRIRVVNSQPQGPHTERQLVAHVRAMAGAEPARQRPAI
jgi:hypothetical protein